jgi:cell division protein FtsZ
MDFGFRDIMDFHDQEHANSERRMTDMFSFGDEDPAARSGPAEGGEAASGPAMFQFEEEKLPARIKVVGVGGGGCNAVSTMVQSGLSGVEFVVANTDMQALELAHSPVKIQIGGKLTNGRGAGSNPEIGRNAAIEDTEKIKAALAGADMIFVTAGMGGGTGTGGAPVIAHIARDLGALTVAVVTKPFEFEGELRKRKAEEGIAELKKNVDAMIVIPNERLLNLAEKKTSLLDAFRLADTVLVQAVKGISDVVMMPGHVNVDFADVKTVMANRGRAVMGTGVASGEGRAMEAAHKAISSPLLEDGSIKGARAVLINITGGRDMGIYEFNDAISVIKNEADPSANIKFGTVINPVMSEELMVTVIATGFDEEGIRERVKRPTNLREFMKVADRPNLKRRQEAFEFKNETLGIECEDLDKPTFLRRQAD